MRKLLQKRRQHYWKKEYMLKKKIIFTAIMESIHSRDESSQSFDQQFYCLEWKRIFPKIMKFKSLVVKKVSEVYQSSINKRNERMECQRSWKSMPPGRSRPNAIADSIVMHGKSHGKWKKKSSLPWQHCTCSHAKTKESPLIKRLIVYNFCQASDLRGQRKSRGILIQWE